MSSVCRLQHLEFSFGSTGTSLNLCEFTYVARLRVIMLVMCSYIAIAKEKCVWF